MIGLYKSVSSFFKLMLIIKAQCNDATEWRNSGSQHRVTCTADAIHHVFQWLPSLPCHQLDDN
jgi:hypothetical protein